MMEIYLIVAFIAFLIALRNGPIKATLVGLAWPIYVVVTFFGVVVLPIILVFQKGQK